MEVYQALRDKLASSQNIEVCSSTSAQATGCHGLCSRGPFIRILPDDITYCQVKESDIPEIINKTLQKGELIKRLLLHDPDKKQLLISHREINFYNKQLKVALRNVGEIDPASIQDYIERGGYQALTKAIKTMTPGGVIDEIIQSGLRGRGGGGFPTGLKWKACASVDNPPRYIICNGDEGDPGAFMDESIMEGDPHTVLEGMAICAQAIGASSGFIYVRDEYAQSVASLTQAIQDAHQHGFLGENILGSNLSFEVELIRGGGAFVCGEETALMASIEGNIGEPRDKYIFPSEKGLWGQPTIINNVETWANIPVIINAGAAHFASIGTERSKGTKVFSLVGKVVNTGLVEVPMGTTLREIVFDIGGGIPNKRKFKAVQTGGPSGGCIPENLLDLKVDFDSLSQAGSMMGSGGLIVMDDRTCMVEIARYYVNFLAGESCGKCVPCREGIRHFLEILTRICQGAGRLNDLDLLAEISTILQEGSLCALGRTAANPVLSTLKHFREEYLAHINEHRCPAGICKELTEFYIDAELCNGCGLCVDNCSDGAITGAKKQVHVINSEKCIKCGECINHCNFLAIKVK
jgi:NADH-quinone oxidoreductase subunit F